MDFPEELMGQGRNISLSLQRMVMITVDKKYLLYHNETMKKTVYVLFCPFVIVKSRG